MSELTNLADELAEQRNERHVVDIAFGDGKLLVETDGSGHINATSFEANVNELTRFTGEQAQNAGAADGNHIIAFENA